MQQKQKHSIKRRQFLKTAGQSLSASLLLSHGLIRLAYRLQGNVRRIQTAGTSLPASVSFENPMPDVTIDAYVGQIPNIRPEAYHHRYVVYTDPGRTLNVTVNNPSSNLRIDVVTQEDETTPGTWYVDVYLRSSGQVSSDTVEFQFSDAAVGIENRPQPVARHFQVYPAYPNPFNAAVKIDYRLPFAMPVEAAVYNTGGQKVATLLKGRQNAGRHSLIWKPAAHLPSGVYFFRLKTVQGQKSIRMEYVK